MKGFTRLIAWGGALAAVALAVTVGLAASRGPDSDVTIVVPDGAYFSEVTDTLSDRGVIAAPGLFRVYARLRGHDRNVKSGSYLVPAGAGWRKVLMALTEGQVITVPMTIPEGFWLVQMAPRIAEITGQPEGEVLALLQAPGADASLGVPGPGLEGYLFPDTYMFASGVSTTTVLTAMVARYREAWTPERRARLDSIDLSEREIVTLASIIQAEARVLDEMPTISSVYHNRIERGWLLQADPTVLYALGGRRERLLYAAIDSVAANPYNTYSQRGLPPGPIGAPGEMAIEAALYPADTDYMFFVARPDGSHAFTRTLSEHNREKEESRQQRDARRPQPQP
jgi:UPF0755 protein